MISIELWWKLPTPKKEQLQPGVAVLCMAYELNEPLKLGCIVEPAKGMGRWFIQFQDGTSGDRHQAAIRLAEDAVGHTLME